MSTVPPGAGVRSAAGCGPFLPEDDGTAAVQQDAVLGVPADGTGERDPLGVPADGGEAFWAARMVDPGDLLLDDGALV